MDHMKVAQMVELLNGLTARDALCLLVGCLFTVLNEARCDEERQPIYRWRRNEARSDRPRVFDQIDHVPRFR